MEKRFRFWHERLDVYRAAIRFVRYVTELDSQWFRGRADRGNQLKRAADSTALNIAEGCGQLTPAARKNHDRIALGSTAECDAVLHILEVHRSDVTEGREILSDIGAVLWGMIR